jgi:hypothetical protein
MIDASVRASLGPTVTVAHFAAAITIAASMISERRNASATGSMLRNPIFWARVGAAHTRCLAADDRCLLEHPHRALSGDRRVCQVLAIISEADQERELKRFTAAIRFTKGLGSDAVVESIKQTIAYRREKFLFAYVVGILQRTGLSDLRTETSKYPILVAINLVNCIATARRTTP